MLVLKRRPGESVEIPSYGVTIKVARVVDSQSVWLWIDGGSYGPLREGGKVKIGDVVLCVTGFHGSKVKTCPETEQREMSEQQYRCIMHKKAAFRQFDV